MIYTVYSSATVATRSVRLNGSLERTREGRQLVALFGLEERVAQTDVLHVLESRIFGVLRIEVEEHRHVHLFARL